MSLFANIDHLAAADGVVALTVETPGQGRAFRGVDRWAPLLDGAMGLLALTDEPTVRLVVGEHTIVVQRELGQIVAVVLPTGHAVAKSLRRMIRRMARKERGPYVAPAWPRPCRPTASPASAERRRRPALTSAGRPGDAPSGRSTATRRPSPRPGRRRAGLPTART